MYSKEKTNKHFEAEKKEDSNKFTFEEKKMLELKCPKIAKTEPNYATYISDVISVIVIISKK